MSLALEELGWDRQFADDFARHARSGLVPGRVAREDRDRYSVLTAGGEQTGRLSGRCRHLAADRQSLPVVGDWVALRVPPGAGEASLRAVLPRRSQFRRKGVLAGGPAYRPGRTEVQLLASNVDVAFLVSGLDRDFNPRRIERYLAIAWDSGARPVVVLNKADLCADPQGAVAALGTSTAGAEVLVVSAMLERGLDDLRAQLGLGRTGVFLGSSGVGKSTLVNRLCGQERQEVLPVREHDGRGRHATAVRELILLPGGGLLIDTPGLRELQPWDDEGGFARVFGDIEELAAGCRFRDCRHLSEPGCAVQEALVEGRLDESHLRNYRRLLREQAQLAARREQRARRRPGLRRR